MFAYKKIASFKWLPIIVIIFFVVIYYLPIISNSDLILKRGNDLGEFFWPILNFTKYHLIHDGTLPLWNSLFLAGTPLLPDPQSPIFYPLNFLALIFPLNSFFIISFVIHSIIAGWGMYLLSNNGFKFSKRTSLMVAIIYLTAPKLSGYLEAGHVGLIYSFSWIPFIILSILQLLRTPNIKYSIVLSVSLALLYYSHLPTLIVIGIVIGILFLGAIILKYINLTKKTILFFAISGIIALGLTAVSLFPQIESQKSSTRYLLLEKPDVYPKWNSIFEPLKIATIPWATGINNFYKIDTEKWVVLGIFTTILSIFGFFKLKIKDRIVFIVLIGFLFTIILNNASPIYSVLLKQNWYLLLRVSTRFWVIIIFVSLYLAGFAIENFSKKKGKIFVYSLAILAIIESISLSWLYLQKPISKNNHLAPKEVYDYITQDKSTFRVFCLTRCLSQKESSIYGLQLLDGYSTIQLRNFNQEAWQLTGTFWDYYTLSIPPIGSYVFGKLDPDPKSLGEYNVKYIISPYKLVNENLIFKSNIQSFNIYENKLYLPRAYFNNQSVNKLSEIPIIINQPNFISLDTSNYKSNQIILSEVYTSGWKGYLNHKFEAKIMETPNALRAVDISPETTSVDFVYKPDSYVVGKWFTFLTLTSIISILIFDKWKHQ